MGSMHFMYWCVYILIRTNDCNYMPMGPHNHDKLSKTCRTRVYNFVYKTSHNPKLSTLVLEQKFCQVFSLVKVFTFHLPTACGHVSTVRLFHRQTFHPSSNKNPALLSCQESLDTWTSSDILRLQ